MTFDQQYENLKRNALQIIQEYIDKNGDISFSPIRG
jgi:hypothetical protein